MLTEDDIKAIKRVVDSAVEPVASDVLGLKHDVSGLKEDVLTLKQDVSGLKVDVSGLKKGQNKTNKLLTVVISLFDKEDVRLKKRMDRVEERLGLKPFPL